MLIEWKNPHGILETKHSHVQASISFSKMPHVIFLLLSCDTRQASNGHSPSITRIVFLLKKLFLFFKVNFFKIKNLSIFMLCNALSHRPYWNQACLVGSESNTALFKYCLRPRALNYTFNPPIFPLHLCRRGGYA
jgi:hypothetical protein